MEKIGVLLPRSTFYASMSFDIVEGLRAGFKNAGRDDIELVIENIGFGAEKQVCYQAAENLLLKEDVQIVIAYLGHRMANLLRPLFTSANRLLIVLDSGANLPQEYPPSDHIIYHSLHDSLCCWMSSQLAIRDEYQEGGMLTCYYDGGYLHTLAITKSYVENGGTIKFNHATGNDNNSFSMDELSTHIANYPKASFLALFSADYTQSFFDKIPHSVIAQQTPVYTSAFMMEESALTQMPFPKIPAKGVVPWSRSIQNKENERFIHLLDEVGKEANYFSLIAYESIPLVLECMKLLIENKKRVSVATQGLKDFTFDSPRGKVYFHHTSKHTLSNLYEAELIACENSMTKVKIVDEITDVSSQFDKMYNLELNNTLSGWYNSYTCI